MGKFREPFALRLAARALLGAVLLFLAPVVRGEASPSFDPPLRERVVNLGTSPGSNGPAKLTCDYYPSFMVKQLDLGEEGANWIAIVPARAGHFPACTRAHAAAEKVIPGQDWCGYFQGARQDFVFLNACDAYNGGLDFAVYDARTGTRIFEDTAVDSKAGGLQFGSAPDGVLVLRYSRVVVFACTLPREQASCWSRIESKLGLENVAAPLCMAYEKQMTGSVISYPVEVALPLTPGLRPPQARAVAGEIRCWPPE